MLVGSAVSVGSTSNFIRSVGRKVKHGDWTGRAVQRGGLSCRPCFFFVVY